MELGGIYPAMPVPFHDDLRVDTDELERLADWLVGHEGISGLVTNGIAGEVFALTPDERAEVTRVVAKAADGRVPVISGLYCERLDEVEEQGLAAKAAGASALLVMPPGRWLRYGMKDRHVTDHFQHATRSSDLPMVTHMYPAWTKAAYSPTVLSQLASMPEVMGFKVGTREMSQYESNIRIIREASDTAAVLTCQDEFLLASMVVGVDGAMVGFASFVPDLVVELFRAVDELDLGRAQQVYERIYPLNRLVYGDDHPNYENYPRMKTAMVLSGRLRTDVVRPPIEPTDAAATAEVRDILEDAGLVTPA